MRATPDRVDEAEHTLAEQGMPPEEIRAVLGAADPRIVHRYLELHRERLREQLDDQRRVVDLLERLLLDQEDSPFVPTDPSGRKTRFWLPDRNPSRSIVT